MTYPGELSAQKDWETTLAQARKAALRLLAYRARSEAEIRRRLQKHYPPEIAGRVVAELRDQRYLDDAAFAREWRMRREQKRPRGTALLRQELLSLGVEADVVREALAGFDAAENAYRAALTVARRLAGSEYPRFRQRLWSHLLRRGFEHTVIGEAVDRLWRELADPLDGEVDADPQE